MAESISSLFTSPNLNPALDKDTSETFWLPGRWIGGVSLIVAPMLLLTGTVLRLRFHFFFPQQLQAYNQYPALMMTSYSLYLGGNLLLWPAILTLTRLIGKSKPIWAQWGGCIVIMGLFARCFHAGIDHMAFQLVKILKAEAATKVVAASYGAFHIVSALSFFIFFGWIVLAIGAYLSGTLGLLRSIALASMAALMMGVLKGSSWISLISICGLNFALLPLGLQLLTARPRPTLNSVLKYFIFGIALLSLLFYLGQLG